MDNLNKNNLNKNTQNEEFVSEIVECGLDLATERLENFATHNVPEDVDIPIETSNSLDLDVDDIDDGGIFESLLDNLDNIPIVGIIIGGIVVIGGIALVIKKLRKK